MANDIQTVATLLRLREIGGIYFRQKLSKVCNVLPRYLDSKTIQWPRKAA